jgi:hypothetical protein
LDPSTALAHIMAARSPYNLYVDGWRYPLFQMRPSTRAKQISFCKKFSALVPADDPVIIEPVSGAGNFAISVHDGMRYSPKLQQIKRLERNSLANVTGNLQGGIREAQHANTGTGSEAPEIQTASHHELACHSQPSEIQAAARLL